ncbi:membrane-associated protein, putative [Bodo saltans]|uniref:Membrane-associated protein, putative n=1 Tax=Bodo saltans TaxID=75058 RepID=A0A0S4JVN8_BODSA|nr:membrane-associated protein, putative [Bodo saltans]|eukprot:CUG93509.1 membrane-associated protein, putative [Bodo saltans]
MISTGIVFAVLLASCLAAKDVISSQKPFAAYSSDDALPINKFSQRHERSMLRVDSAAANIRDELFGVDYITNNNGTCDHGIHLMWTAQLGSSIFATPRIVDLHSDGNKEILVPTYTQYIEALDGVTGEDLPGFPFTHPHFQTLSSPLPVDLNGDGILEWMFSTYTGELMFLDENGHVAKTIKIPPLPLKKDWNKRPNGNHSTAEKVLSPMEIVTMRIERLIAEGKVKPLPGVKLPERLQRKPTPTPPTTARKLQSVDERAGSDDLDMDDGGAEDVHGGDEDDDSELEHDTHHGYDDYLRDEYGENPYDDYGMAPDVSEGIKGATIGVDGWLSPEAKESMDLVFHPELYQGSVNVDPEHDPFHFTNLDSGSAVIVGSDEIAVDAHILATPVIVDMDGDGALDAVVHVSYFFDSTYYSRAENQNILPDDVEPTNYVADAVVCIGLLTGKVSWLRLLHVTTSTVKDPAFGLSSPTVVNINRGPLFDVFVTTTSGHIFGFDGRGAVLKGWPVTMAPILSSALAEDVDGDGNVDICAGDIKGNVACFRGDGQEIWERQVSGAVSDTPTAGDVDGDGWLDLVVSTSAGGIYAIEGRHGGILKHFPILTHGPVIAPSLLLNLNNSNPPAIPETSKGLHIIVPSHDGHLYIISGPTGCYERIDIGEKSSSMVLADDLTNNGMLDLVVSTLSGSVLAYSTDTPFHPLKQWGSRIKALNGGTASEGHIGVFIAPESRQPRDIRGDRFQLLVTIVDSRPNSHRSFNPRYVLTVLIGTRVIVFQGIFFEAKSYALELHSPLERVYANVRVVLSLENGQHFEDMVALSFNMHFLETIKFLLLGPFLLVVLALSFVRKEHTIKMTQYMAYQYNARGRRDVYYVYDE